jgi:sulfate transport system substrate-binding protein
LVDSGVVLAASWQHLPHRGAFSSAPMVILVQPGNPKGIRDFEDLARAGVKVLHPNPLSSGAGEWSILAVYGAALRADGDRQRAYQRLAGVWNNVSALPSSASAAHAQFETGAADATITYESEAVHPTAGGVSHQIVRPQCTILSQHIVVRVDRNIEPEKRELVDALIRFLWSDRAQRILVEHGFRSVQGPGAQAEASADLFTLADLGGARRARREIIEAQWRQQLAPTEKQ